MGVVISAGGAGKVKWNVAPRPPSPLAQIRPPCDSTIDLLIAKPMPLPSGFVVKNASNIWSTLCWGSPREAAKQDQLRARHRLGKFLLRSGQRPPSGVRAWTHLHLIWVSQIRFAQAAQESTRLDYLHEVEHMRERVLRLEQAIVEAVKLASPALQEVITDLQALRGIAHISAVTIAAELGQVSRFAGARELMGYCGAVPSENSSGKRTRRGGITKTGNAHLRRIVVEAAWSYHRPPAIWAGLRKRQQSASEEAKEIAWKAQHRLHKRYARLAATGKDKRKIVTAVGRELLGFIWAIGTKAEATVRQRIAA
jgi:transposase